MRILISNDDGISAPGIRMLAQRLSRDPHLEVYVVAPDRERSATGHSLTLHKPLRVEKVYMEGNVKGAWATTGTPADCVKFAIIELLGFVPDVVVSGINSGPNLGSDVLYSGTVAAAMEGAFFKIPSIAVSLVAGEQKHYDSAAEFIARFLVLMPSLHLRPKSLLNINCPNVPLAQVEGIAITELGVRLYDDRYEKRADPRGRVYYWLAGQAIDEGEEETTDVWAVVHNMISITPISFNMTDRDSVQKLSQLLDLKSLITPGNPELSESGQAADLNG